MLVVAEDADFLLGGPQSDPQPYLQFEPPSRGDAMEEQAAQGTFPPAAAPSPTLSPTPSPAAAAAAAATRRRWISAASAAVGSSSSSRPPDESLTHPLAKFSQLLLRLEGDAALSAGCTLKRELPGLSGWGWAVTLRTGAGSPAHQVSHATSCHVMVPRH